MCLILFVAAFTVFVILFFAARDGGYFTRRLNNQINPDFGRIWAALGKNREFSALY
jgi:predicted PurR-regulated permease PerM